MQQMTVAVRAPERALARGEEEVQRALLLVSERRNRRLFRIARSILGDDAEAEDAVQESYLRALGSLDDLRDERHVEAWLARIAVNEALQRLRRRRRSVPLAEIAEALPDDTSRVTTLLSPFGRQSPEDAAMQREVRTLLERAIDKLPVHFRSVFVACDIEQMSVADAAAALGLYPITVKTRLFRARRLLRRSLGQEFLGALPAAFPCAGERCERIRKAVAARVAAGLPSHPPLDERPSKGEVS